MKIRFCDIKNIQIQFNYKQKKIINKKNSLLSIFLIKIRIVIIFRYFNEHFFVQKKLLAYKLLALVIDCFK